jgi:uncharacterized protein YvpB
MILVIIFSLVGFTVFSGSFKSLVSSEAYESLYAGSLDTEEANLHVLPVPFVRQKPWYCSESSASMVLQYYGFTVSQDDVHDAGFDRFENMLPFLQRYVNAEYRQLNIEALKEQIDLGNPVIIRVMAGEYRHSIVVVGYDENYIYVHDPAVGPYLKAKPNVLLEVWRPTGYLSIVLSPS